MSLFICDLLDALNEIADKFLIWHFRTSRTIYCHHTRYNGLIYIQTFNKCSDLRLTFPPHPWYWPVDRIIRNIVHGVRLVVPSDMVQAQKNSSFRRYWFNSYLVLCTIQRATKLRYQIHHCTTCFCLLGHHKVRWNTGGTAVPSALLRSVVFVFMSLNRVNVRGIFKKFPHFLLYKCILLMIIKSKYIIFQHNHPALQLIFFPASYQLLNAIIILVAHAATDAQRSLCPRHIDIFHLLDLLQAAQKRENQMVSNLDCALDAQWLPTSIS